MSIWYATHKNETNLFHDSKFDHFQNEIIKHLQDIFRSSPQEIKVQGSIY